MTNDGYEVPCLRIECYHPSWWHHCLYCLSDETGHYCTLEGPHSDDEVPCGDVDSPGGRPSSFSPAPMLTPRSGYHDIFYSDSPFRAGGGVRPEGSLAKYYLKPFACTLGPFALGSGFDQDQCSVWLCTIVAHEMASQPWTIWCLWPITMPDPGTPTGSGGGGYPVPQYTCAGEDQPREYACRPTSPGDWRIAIVHLSFTREHGNCFPTLNQFCFSTKETDVFDNVGSSYPGHVNELDSLAINVQARLGNDARFPHAEPEYFRICNLALGQVSDHQSQINAPGHYPRDSNYDSDSLSLWLHDTAVNEPIVDTAEDEPYPHLEVNVRPYLTNTLYPADLLISHCRYTLRLTPEPGWDHVTGGGDVVDGARTGQLRMHATIEVWVWLKPKLRPGYQDISGPMTLVVNEVDGVPDPSDFWFLPDPADPNTVRPYITQREGCKQVPLLVKWRGLLSVEPWSAVDSPWLDSHEKPAPCCDVLYAIDGLVIPAEVNNTWWPTDDNRQMYRGYVVLNTNIDPSEISPCG
jgi:hypothetical protein